MHSTLLLLLEGKTEGYAKNSKELKSDGAKNGLLCIINVISKVDVVKETFRRKEIFQLEKRLKRCVHLGPSS